MTTLAPGVDFWDTGEMQTVPYVLGIAHPTGFPLFVVAGWCFSHVVAFGNVAWRLSLFSGLASAAAAWLLFVFVRDITRDAPVALAGALAFAVGDIVWTRAIRAEVHDLALAFTALALVVAARAGARRSPRAIVLAAFACGCGLATHPVVVLAIPAVLIFAWPAVRRLSPSRRLVALSAALAPLAAYAYIPLRSAYVVARGLDPSRDAGIAGGAFFNYGSPETPHAFWAYVTGAAFHPADAFATFASFGGATHALGVAHDVLYREYSYVALALAMLGFGALVARQRRLALGLAVLFIAALAFVPNYGAESDGARYALPALWALSACAAIGAEWLARTVADGRPRAASLAAVAALAVSLWPNAAAAFIDTAHARLFDDAREVGPAIANHTADGSLIVAAWTFATPIAYDAYVEHEFGSRLLLSGWPHDFPGRYARWRARYKHVYFVVGNLYDVTPFARTIYVARRWQLAEMR